MKKENIWIGAFLIGKILLQFLLVNPAYDLQRDEYLHLDQAFHPAWGYLSVPPMTSWISKLIFLLGGGEFWVRFFPALVGSITILVILKTVRALGGGFYALALAGTGALFSTMLRLNMLFQPNAIDVLTWTTLFYLLVQYFKTKNRVYFYYLGICVGLGFLNKYNIVFAVLGLLPALLVTKSREIFLSRHLYGSMLIALLIISPNLLWQYNEGWPVIHHMQDLSATQLVNNNVGSFLKSQALFFLGSLPVLVLALYALLFENRFSKYRFLFWSTIFTLLFFIYFKAKDYYAFGIYPILLGFGSVYVEKAWAKKWQMALKAALLVLPPLSLYPVKDVIFPVRSPQYVFENAEQFKSFGMLRWEDGKDHHLPQDFADMLGWKELAILVDSVYANVEDKAHTILLADNYGQAGAINYYSKFEDLRCQSFNADYVNWMDTSTTYVNAILIKEEDDEDPERLVEKPLFDTVYLAAKRIQPLAREAEISIYVLKGAKVDVNQRIISEMEAEKNKFRNE